MKRLQYDKSAGMAEQFRGLFNRPAYPPQAEEAARRIIDAVSQEGDAALVRFAKEFDHYDLDLRKIRVPREEINAACRRVAPSDRRAIDLAVKHITDYAEAVKPVNRKWSARNGVLLGEKFSPMDRVGVYIPGGTAPLVSTVIHTAAIARAAGVPEIVACTPPGALHPQTLYAMRMSGVTEVYRLGGVYAVAAMALGTGSISPVQKIAGPGNAYVTAAKKLLYGRVAIDLVAGPSEVLIIADETARPEFVAADLLSQAEHGSGFEQAVLVATSKTLIDRVEREILRQKKLLARESIIDKVLENGTYFIEVPDLESAADFANRYAPEHEELQVADPVKLSRHLTAAGALFLGEWTPEPIGDFCAGPSHVLPTATSALRFNGLSTCDFMRRSSIVEYTRRAIMREGSVAERFGGMECLAAHANSVTVRMRALERAKAEKAKAKKKR